MPRNAIRGTVVSLTPLRLEADSRTFRIASSLAEAGWHSIVIEGRASATRFWGDAVEVRSLGSQAIRGAMTSPRQRARGGAAAMARSGRLGGGGELALYLGFRSWEWWHHCWRPRGCIPPAELYYLHSFEFHRAVAPVTARTGARIIYDAHDFYRGILPAERQAAFDRNRVRPFFDALEARLAAAADATVTVSEGIAAMMERTFGRRPTVLRNYHDERLDQAVVPDLRTSLSLAPADRLCVVVGNRKPGMAVDTAVDALAMLPTRFHLAFVGRGYEAESERLRPTSGSLPRPLRAPCRAKPSGSVYSHGRSRSGDLRTLFRQLPVCLAQRLFPSDCGRTAARSRGPPGDRSGDRPPPCWRASRSSRPAILGRGNLALCRRPRRVA